MAGIVCGYANAAYETEDTNITLADWPGLFFIKYEMIWVELGLVINVW